MNISWSLHELTKETNWIIEVGLSDHEVDKNTQVVDSVLAHTL